MVVVCGDVGKGREKKVRPGVGKVSIIAFSIAAPPGSKTNHKNNNSNNNNKNKGNSSNKLTTAVPISNRITSNKDKSNKTSH